MLLSSRNRYLALTLASGVSLGFYAVIGFLRIAEIVEEVLSKTPRCAIDSLEAALSLDGAGRRAARKLVADQPG